MVRVGCRSNDWIVLTYLFSDSIYRLPVQSPSATAKEIKSRALDLQPVLEEVQVKHPLVGWKSSTDTQEVTNCTLHSLSHRFTP